MQGLHYQSACIFPAVLFDPTPFEPEIRALEARFQNQPPGAVAFYGSSSVRLWPRLKTEFPQARIQNFGFGGSTLADCAHYFSRLIVPHGPAAIVFYAGDNDLANGASPAEVWTALDDLLNQRDAALGAVPFAFLSVKPSPARRALLEAIRETNEWCRREIESRPGCRWVEVFEPMVDAAGEPRPELYMADELHLSRAGYALWNDVLHNEAGDLLS